MPRYYTFSRKPNGGRMSINLGNTTFSSLYLGSTKIGEAYLGSVKVYGSAQPDPYNPLQLPPYTLRLRFTNGTTPTFSRGTATQVSSSPNVWDLTYESSDWHNLVMYQSNLVEVLGANSSGVTNMLNLFYECRNLADVALFDTSSAENVSYMFCNTAVSTVPVYDTSNATSMVQMLSNCPNLTTPPALDTSKATTIMGLFAVSPITSVPSLNLSSVTGNGLASLFYKCTALSTIPAITIPSGITEIFDICGGCTSLRQLPNFSYPRTITNVDNAFNGCVNVTSNIVSTYNNLVNIGSVTSHSHCFYNCGSNTTSGSAELARIPSGWK